ncbi:MAG: HNH endonuclease signature motif containing protein [Eubacteriales bacterium]|nr:HNH endonuclease signature motif containing protein [Eubacteriales bacterium]
MANKTNRSDRQPGNRGAFEAARQKILKTQTVCGICGKPVDFSYRFPHPLSPTVDHIIPVSKGGHPSDISNLQLAHRCCNRQKADKLTEPRQMNDTDKLVPNDLLEQHCDWKNYRSKQGG